MPFGAPTPVFTPPTLPKQTPPTGGGGTQPVAAVIQSGQEMSSVDQGGLLSLGFAQSNVTASQTAVALIQEGIQVPVVMPYRGSLAALSVSASEAKTAGTATITVYINGVATSLSIVWDTGADTDYSALVQGTVGFEAGAEIDVRITTDSTFTPTTVDIVATLIVAVSPTTTL